MSAEPNRIQSLIESIADGGVVNWDDVDVSAIDERQRRLIGHLRLVAGLAEVHRTTPMDDPGNMSATLDTSGVFDASAPFEVGRAFPRWGHLQLLEKIGDGTFGEVYRARDPWLDREVALKLLKPVATPNVRVSRVLNEARTLARVRHPNVVTVHGADLHEGRVGLWMEFVRGRTLSAMLAAQGPLSASEAAIIGQDLCRALGAVHASGLVHGDVKAQNVMRESGGRLLLMDFGAGQASGGMRPATTRATGTPLYLAPEVFEGSQATVQTDIYALGVLLFLLVSGKYPVKGASFEDLAAAHARGDRRRLRDVRPDLPDSFVAAVERAIEPNAQRRFTTTGEMMPALARVTSGSFSSRMAAIRPQVRARIWKWKPLAAAAAVLVLVAGLGTATWMWRDNGPAPVTSVQRISTVAVLPFENTTNNDEEDYLGQAVSLELTARLGQIGAIKTVPWSFMKRFATSGVSLTTLGSQTGADAVVEGAVEIAPRSENGARLVQVRVQLYHASTGTLLWSDSFARDMADFFALQADIARELAARINVVLANREQAALSRARRVSPEAMELYLKGRQSLEAYEDGFRPAVNLLQRTVQSEPGFAEAHAALANAIVLQSAYSGATDSAEAYRRAVAEAREALVIDPDLPEAWSARGFAKLALAWDWPGAAADLRRALDLDPNSATAHGDYSNYLTIVGRHEDALKEALIAEARVPFSTVHSRRVGWAYYHGRSYEAAIAQLRQTLTLDSSYDPARTLLARTYVMNGQFVEAIREIEATGPVNDAMRAQIYATAGRRDDAVRTLKRVLAPSYTFARRPYHIALVYAALGDRDACFEWLQRAFQQKDANMAHLAVDPALDPVRSDPRFAGMLAKMKFRQVQP